MPTDSDAADASAPRPGDHVRGDGDALPAGVHRVVGVDDERATLLRVTDADGRRVNSGELSSVGLDHYRTLPDAENPDASSPLVPALLLLVGVGLVAAAVVPETPPTAGFGLDPTALLVAGLVAAVVGGRRLLAAR